MNRLELVAGWESLSGEYTSGIWWVRISAAMRQSFAFLIATLCSAKVLWM
jgi:hypothetical protein